METPSLKEVKKHFKNAKEIKALYPNEVFNISDIEFNFNDFGEDIWLRGLSDIGRNIKLWSKQQGYAKILSYKEPKYTITKEIIEKYQMKDEFPEMFKTELIVGKWYKGTECNTHKLFCFNGEYDSDKDPKGYGFCGNPTFWMKSNGIGWGSNGWIEASEQEIFEALKNEAVKRGFKEGVYFNGLNDNGDGRHIGCCCSKTFEYYNNELSVVTDEKTWKTNQSNPRIFSNGKWAEIIPIKKKEEAEKELNCKIID